MKLKPTPPTTSDGADPPRFTREMAERGRHLIGETVIQEPRPNGRRLKAEA